MNQTRDDITDGADDKQIDAIYIDKAKTCLAGIRFAIRNYFQMLPMMPDGPQVSQKLKEGLTLKQEDFEYRLEADQADCSDPVSSLYQTAIKSISN